MTPSKDGFPQKTTSIRHLKGFGIFFLSLHQVNSKIVVQFCYLRLPFVIKTLFFRQLQRMPEGWTWIEKVGPTFSIFKAHAYKNHQ